MSFKVGDQVVCISDFMVKNLVTVGRVYRVIGRLTSNTIEIESDIGQHLCFAQELFKSITQLGEVMEWKSPTFTDGSCAHELVNYVGFRESYKFCKKCDHKESL